MTKLRDRLSIPPFVYADDNLEYQYFEEKRIRMMLPSGRMVTVTPTPSEFDDNQAYSMPELGYLQSRSFSPNLFGKLTVFH